MKIIVLSFFTVAAAASSFGQSARLDSATNILQITPALVNQIAEEARTNHPSLLAAKARIEAAQHNEKSVRTWEDPMARIGVMAAEEMMRAEDGDLLFELEQKLPLFGKTKAARAVAKTETSVEEAKSEYTYQQLRKDVAQSIFRIGLADRKVQIANQDVGWLETILSVAEQRYQIGEANQMDVLRLQNERAKRLNEIKTADRTAEYERVNLNKLVGRDLHRLWPRFELPNIAGPIQYNARLVNMAVQNEPKLKTLRQEIKRAEAMKEQVRRERYPDLTAGVEVRDYSGNGDIRQSMFTLGFNLPWGNRKKYTAAADREEARRQAAEFDVSDYERTLRDEVFRLTVQIDTARREALLYRNEIIPRSEGVLESARASWEANRGMFRDLLDARRMLLEAQLMYTSAVAEQYQMMSELVLCCGLGDLEALEMIGGGPEMENQK